MAKRLLTDLWCPSVWDRVHQMKWVSPGFAMCSLCGYMDVQGGPEQFYDDVEEGDDNEQEDATAD